MAILTGVLFGISPAWQLSTPQIGALVQAGSSKHTGSARSRKSHRILIAGQLALTLLLIATAGAALKAFQARLHTPLGYDPKNVLSLNVGFPKSANPTWEGRLNAQEAVRKVIAETHVAAQVNSSHSLGTIFFTEQPVRDYAGAKRSDTKRYARFFREMLDRGIFLAPSQFEAAFVSTVHTRHDIDRTIAAAADSLRVMAADSEN